MAIRLVFFSDTHLGFDYPVRPRSDRPLRGPDFFANFQRVLDYARHTSADLVVHGGDFFFRSKVPPSIVDSAYQALMEFASSGIPIVIVPGNHERSVLPASLFLSHPHIHILDRPRTYSFEVHGERLAISGFPYLENVRGRFDAAVEACASDRATAHHRLLCVHHAVDGAVVGPGNFTFRGGADVIAGSSLPGGFDAVLSGHVHRHQVLAERVPVIYCGSVERTSFAEKSETKGFCEVNLQRGARSPEITFHPLPTRPMEDFDGREYPEPATLLDAFTRQSANWSQDAIVRVRLRSYPDGALSKALARVVPGPLNVSCTSWSRGVGASRRFCRIVPAGLRSGAGGRLMVALDDRSLGWLRYLHRKATTPDNWDRSGQPHAHWDDITGEPMTSWHRFDLIDSSYAVALMSDRTPAWRELYGTILDELVSRHTSWWSASDWMTQFGHDPDRADYPDRYRPIIPPSLWGDYDVPGWTANGIDPYGVQADPIAADGMLFYKGFFTLLMSLHRYVSGDAKWDNPFEMIRDGENTFTWSHSAVAAHLARQWHNSQIGCHCENTKIWPY